MSRKGSRFPYDTRAAGRISRGSDHYQYFYGRNNFASKSIARQTLKAIAGQVLPLGLAGLAGHYAWSHTPDVDSMEEIYRDWEGKDYPTYKKLPDWTLSQGEKTFKFADEGTIKELADAYRRLGANMPEADLNKWNDLVLKKGEDLVDSGLDPMQFLLTPSGDGDSDFEEKYQAPIRHIAYNNPFIFLKKNTPDLDAALKWADYFEAASDSVGPVHDNVVKYQPMIRKGLTAMSGTAGYLTGVLANKALRSGYQFLSQPSGSVVSFRHDNTRRVPVYGFSRPRRGVPVNFSIKQKLRAAMLSVMIALGATGGAHAESQLKGGDISMLPQNIQTQLNSLPENERNKVIAQVCAALRWHSSEKSKVSDLHKISEESEELSPFYSPIKTTVLSQDCVQAAKDAEESGVALSEPAEEARDKINSGFIKELKGLSGDITLDHKLYKEHNEWNNGSPDSKKMDERLKDFYKAIGQNAEYDKDLGKDGKTIAGLASTGHYRPVRDNRVFYEHAPGRKLVELDPKFPLSVAAQHELSHIRSYDQDMLRMFDQGLPEHVATTANRIIQQKMNMPGGFTKFRAVAEMDYGTRSTASNIPPEKIYDPEYLKKLSVEINRADQMSTHIADGIVQDMNTFAPDILKPEFRKGTANASPASKSGADLAKTASRIKDRLRQKQQELESNNDKKK